MSQRISQLTPLESSLPSTSLFEVAVPNPESPTGYVTRSVTADKIGGGGGSMPYRYTIRYNESINDGLPITSFWVTIPESEFSDVKFVPNAEIAPEYDEILNSALIQCNLLVALTFNYDSNFASSGMALINSDYWFNQTAFNDGNRVRLRNFDSTDGNIYATRNDPPPIDNELSQTWTAYPNSVTYYPEAGIEIEFKLQPPSGGSGGNDVTGIKVAGYIDMTTMFGPTDNPV